MPQVLPLASNQRSVSQRALLPGPWERRAQQLAQLIEEQPKPVPREQQVSWLVQPEPQLAQYLPRQWARWVLPPH